LLNVQRDVTLHTVHAARLSRCHVVITCSFNLQQVQAVQVLEGVLADAGDFVGIQQSGKTIQNTQIVYHNTIQNTQIVYHNTIHNTHIVHQTTIPKIHIVHQTIQNTHIVHYTAVQNTQVQHQKNIQLDAYKSYRVTAQ